MNGLLLDAALRGRDEKNIIPSFMMLSALMIMISADFLHAGEHRTGSEAASRRTSGPERQFVAGTDNDSNMICVIYFELSLPEYKTEALSEPSTT